MRATFDRACDNPGEKQAQEALARNAAQSHNAANAANAGPAAEEPHS